MRHLINNNNLALCTTRLLSTSNFQHVFITSQIADRCVVSSQTKETGYIFPLYLYPETTQPSLIKQDRIPNFNMDKIHDIEQSVNLKFVPEKNDVENTFAPIDVFDYIYCILHSNKYRIKYKEFLKIDFPRIPLPKNKDYFFKLVEIGKQIRNLHLLNNVPLNNTIAKFIDEGDGDYCISKFEYKDNNVYINNKQYFENVPENVWNFYIGGYQPVQHWLKDRKKKKYTLKYDDIIHFHNMIIAVSKTIEIMDEIDKIIEL